MKKPIALLLGAILPALAGAGCSEPLTFPGWTLAVPEGTRIIGFADVGAEERRGKRVELVDDLVIAPREDDQNYSFYLPSEVLADSAGRIYVLDGGESRVQVFDRDGEYVRTLGKAGSGPGEFRGNQGGFITVLAVEAADRLIAYDMAQSRVSVWGPDGVHEGDHAVTGLGFGPFLGGLDNGSFVAVTTERTEGGSRSVVIAVSGVGERLRSYIELPQPENLMVGSIAMIDPAGRPLFAAARDGTVYASRGNEYQVLSLGADGAARWALRVARRRRPFTDEDRARVVAALSENTPELDAGGTVWPSHIGAISRLAVDGHGHLYVFGPVVPFDRSTEEVTVDVYAGDGERLFAGAMPPVRWTDADEDFVYATRTNEDTQEREIVRYRLVEPFAR